MLWWDDMEGEDHSPAGMSVGGREDHIPVGMPVASPLHGCRGGNSQLLQGSV